MTRGAGVGTPFTAEVRIISFNFPPRNWAFCNGQLLSIQQNQALFSLLGTSYGGNGTQTFALPNLQGRTPVHMGGSLGSVTGTVGGEELHTLSLPEMPAHSHFQQAATANGSVATPAANLVAPGTAIYHGATNLQAMASDVIGSNGSGASHENRAPFLVLNFVICLFGIFPSRG
jgi:microcystin-dependent protein